MFFTFFSAESCITALILSMVKINVINQDVLVYFVHNKEFLEGGVLINEYFALTLLKKIKLAMNGAKKPEGIYIGIGRDSVSALDSSFLHRVTGVIEDDNTCKSMNENSKDFDKCLAITSVSMQKHTNHYYNF